MSEALAPGGPVLDYGTPGVRRPRRRLRLVHVWLLPLLWGPASYLSREYHGDEFVGFGMTHVPVVPIAFLWQWSGLERLSQGASQTTTVYLMLVGGVVSLAVAGFLMDLLRVKWWVYLSLPLVLLAVILSRIAAMESVQPMPPRPGSEWDAASLCVAYSWTLTATALAAILGALLTIGTRFAVRTARRGTTA